MAGSVYTASLLVRRRRSRGFTFVELLATVVLLAIVLPTVMGGISMCLSMAGAARQEAQASSLAYGKLMQLVAEGTWQQDASLAGDFGTEQPGYRWTAEVSDWDSTVLKQIDVTVWWRHRNRDRSVVISTLAYTGGTL